MHSSHGAVVSSAGGGGGGGGGGGHSPSSHGTTTAGGQFGTNVTGVTHRKPSSPRRISHARSMLSSDKYDADALMYVRVTSCDKGHFL